MKKRARYLWWDVRFGSLRRLESLTMWTARRLPKRLRYWVVINETNAVWFAAGNVTPDEISSMDILKAMYPAPGLVDTSQGVLPAEDNISPPPTAYSTQAGGFWPHDDD